MKKSFIALTLFALISFACTDNDLQVEPVKDADAFIVDSFMATCSVKKYPLNDSLWSCITCNISYHFTGTPGTMDIYDLYAIGQPIGISVQVYNVNPDSVGTIHQWTQDLWIKNTLPDLDSIRVHSWILGYFWFQGKPPSNREYDWQWIDERTIPILR